MNTPIILFYSYENNLIPHWLCEGNKTVQAEYLHVTREAIQAQLPNFRGDILQVQYDNFLLI